MYVDIYCTRHDIYLTIILRWSAGYVVIDNHAELVIIILYPASPSRIIVLLKTSGLTTLSC